MELKMKKIFLFLLLVGSLTTFAEEIVKPQGITDWIFPGKSLTYKNNVGTFYETMLMSRNFIPVNPAKKYIVEGEFRTSAKKAAKFQIGVVSLSATRRVINPNNTIVVPGSGAVLLKAAPKGSKMITVKTIHRWNPKTKSHIVIKADNKGKFTDLPNFNIVGKVDNVTVKGDKILEVTLKAPLKIDLAANENIRLHNDGAVHVCSKPMTADNQWKKFSHVITGYSKGHTQTNFRHGAKYAKIFVYNHRGNVLEFKNLILKELK